MTAPTPLATSVAVPNPIELRLPGKPGASAVAQKVLLSRTNIAAALAGALVFVGTAPTAATTFTLVRIPQGAVSATASPETIATLTIAAGTNQGVTVAMSGNTFNNLTNKPVTINGVAQAPGVYDAVTTLLFDAGDVLQVRAPANPDNTISDIVFAIPAYDY